MNAMDRVRAAVRDVPDFPKPGILFKDITPVLQSAELFRIVADDLVARHAGQAIARVAAIDARGFFWGGVLADRLGVGLVPIRKKGKLPYLTYEESYELEYGSATLTIHQDACRPGERVVLVDDLLATGGTAAASVRLLERTGARVVGVDFLVELAFLNGRERLKGYDVYAPIVY